MKRFWKFLWTDRVVSLRTSKRQFVDGQSMIKNSLILPAYCWFWVNVVKIGQILLNYIKKEIKLSLHSEQGASMIDFRLLSCAYYYLFYLFFI